MSTDSLLVIQKNFRSLFLSLVHPSSVGALYKKLRPPDPSWKKLVVHLDNWTQGKNLTLNPAIAQDVEIPILQDASVGELKVLH